MKVPTLETNSSFLDNTFKSLEAITSASSYLLVRTRIRYSF